MRTMLSVVAACACTTLGMGPVAQGGHEISAGRSLSARPAKADGTAENLLLTNTVRSALVVAGASHYGLPASDFVGLGAAPNNYPAYYAFDKATSTYWAGASLVPKREFLRGAGRGPRRWCLPRLPPHSARGLAGPRRRVHRYRRYLCGLPREHPRPRGGRMALGPGHVPSANCVRPPQQHVRLSVGHQKASWTPVRLG